MFRRSGELAKKVLPRNEFLRAGAHILQQKLPSSNLIVANDKSISGVQLMSKFQCPLQLGVHPNFDSGSPASQFVRQNGTQTSGRYSQRSQKEVKRVAPLPTSLLKRHH